ncbi:phosphodiesterase [Arsenicicoccus dermatophilus]|uniref:phosphodiesterase n=1 Tax=Arsenicicoccus dermatophilus TaxID=1076331 RepID=UPI001F4C6BE9|nr:phosphodiesterase [Arsenicicoccus dermatophilus]MCH8611930.1 phosphodiesterase [Arsenicicoccus dermatophilus]
MSRAVIRRAPGLDASPSGPGRRPAGPGPRPAGVVLAAGGGALLAATFGLAALVRRDKPLHAYGRVTSGSLVLTGAPIPCGVPLLDRAGSWPCTVRASRTASLTHQGPDVMGLALRVDAAGHDGDHADLLLASTGTGTVTRHLLAVRRRVEDGPLTTLLPQRGASGDVLLRLDPAGSSAYDLSWSRARGAWHRLGRLELHLPWGPDEPLRFAPVDHPLAGLTQPGWVRALRHPAYAAARRLTDPAPPRQGAAT